MDPLKQPDVHIAVMGVTGAGTSTFIKTASKLDNVGIGHGLHSFTETVDSYVFEYNGKTICLIDTPGFNDTSQKEGDVLNAIANWLDTAYRNPPGTKLTGIVYMQSIQEPRMTGSSLLNLRMFEQLCGKDSMRNVLLVTSRWGDMAKAGRLKQAEDNEGELRKDPEFWADLIGEGARMERFEDSNESALRIFSKLASHEARVLQIQKEMVTDGKQIQQTGAGIVVNQELIKMEKEYEEKIQKLRKDIEDAQVEGERRVEQALERERAKTARKLEQLHSQQDVLRYQTRASRRQMEEDIDSLKKANSQLLQKIDDQQLDFDRTIAALEAAGDKLRQEQYDEMRKELEEIKKKPKKERTAMNVVLRILPIVGNLALSLILCPILGVGIAPFGGGGGC